MGKVTKESLRLEELREVIHAQRMSYDELAELQSLADQIDPGDVELLEWAGVPEFPEDEEKSEMAIGRITGRLRFVTSHDSTSDEYFVYDRDSEERAAGPYKTQAQAVYVAYFLNDDPTSVPFAPDPKSVETVGELRRWHA